MYLVPGYIYVMDPFTKSSNTMKFELYMFVFCVVIMENDVRFQDFVNSQLKIMPTLNRRYSQQTHERTGMAGLPGMSSSNPNIKITTSRKSSSTTRSPREEVVQSFVSKLWQQYLKDVPKVSMNWFLIFKRNFKYITTSRVDFEAGLIKYQLEMNHLSHLIIAEIRKHYTGARKLLTSRTRRSF